MADDRHQKELKFSLPPLTSGIFLFGRFPTTVNGINSLLDSLSPNFKPGVTREGVMYHIEHIVGHVVSKQFPDLEEIEEISNESSTAWILISPMLEAIKSLDDECHGLSLSQWNSVSLMVAKIPIIPLSEQGISECSVRSALSALGIILLHAQELHQSLSDEYFKEICESFGEAANSRLPAGYLLSDHNTNKFDLLASIISECDTLPTIEMIKYWSKLCDQVLIKWYNDTGENIVLTTPTNTRLGEMGPYFKYAGAQQDFIFELCDSFKCMGIAFAIRQLEEFT